VFNGAKAVRPNVVQKFRDKHHQMARLFASGLRPSDVAQEMGMSLSRVSVLHTDPAFQELIAAYREGVDEAFRAQMERYYERKIFLRNMAQEHAIERGLRLEEEGDLFTVREAAILMSEADDRTGYGKRTMAINVNVDFAGRLDGARKRASQVMKVLPAPAVFKRRI
jgi:hypothetical protein